MNRNLLYRVLLVLFILILLSFGVFVAFALAAHAGCTAHGCVPCLSLAKAQEILRQFSGIFLAAVGILLLLLLLHPTADAHAVAQRTSNLVRLKMRLNN